MIGRTPTLVTATPSPPILEPLPNCWPTRVASPGKLNDTAGTHPAAGRILGAELCSPVRPGWIFNISPIADLGPALQDLAAG
jgi:hypothetical protein